MKKRGQVTLFIIIAILIVAIVAGYFLLREKAVKIEIPMSIQPIETSFLSCLEEDTLTGIDVLESQGGYIEFPDFEPGSEYMPFSSELDFLGNPIPYWYYVSGNNIKREQIPTKELMQEQLGAFIEDQITNCVLDNYYDLGYEITKGEPEASVIIRDNEVEVDLEMDLSISFGEESAIIKDHKKVVKSSLGELYDSAKKVYDYEQENLFLEEYAIDNLRLYAPVDGVELTCSPLHWNADDVFNNLSEAIEVNTLALRNSGKRGDYFGIDLPVSQEVRFINSKNWPTTFEVSPSDENLLLANPVGNQPGLGILGFCYVPYHFVYDIKYPILIQVFEGGEIFQFPFAVVIQGNNPRESLDASAVSMETIGLCENKNTPVSVSVFDINSAPVEADIFYECFRERCRIGKGSFLEENFPQCVNGFVIVKADGFKQASVLFSSTEGGSLSVYLDRVYKLPVNLKLDGVAYNENAIISFVSDDSSQTIVYPEQKEIELSEGFYDVEVYIYKDSTLELGDITKEQCVDIPIGIFELTRKKCFEIEIPSQLVSNALAGGGKQEYYILEGELSGASSLEISVEKLPSPETIEQLQDNYALFEDKGVEIEFK